MNPIPIRYRKQANENDFYKVCSKCGESPVSFHHSLYYGSNKKQISEIFLPACGKCHDDIKLRKYFQWMAINAYYKYLLVNYPKGNWSQRRHFLNGIYGEYVEMRVIEL